MQGFEYTVGCLQELLGMKLRIRIDEMGTKNMRAARHHITAAGEVGFLELWAYVDLGFRSVAGCGKAALGNCFRKLPM